MSRGLVLVGLVLSVGALGPTVAAAGHICYDAPMLPGAVSGYYDLVNNVYRHYTCHHVVELLPLEEIRDLLEFFQSRHVEVVLP